MAKADLYRCNFLDAVGTVRNCATIEGTTAQEAEAKARELWRQHRHYHGMELWQGRQRICYDARLPDIPTLV